MYALGIDTIFIWMHPIEINELFLGINDKKKFRLAWIDVIQYLLRFYLLTV
jgi:hypothetical protein